MTPRVLLVEDDRRLRELLVRGLHSAGFAVATAAGGTLGWRVGEPPPDAVVVDVAGSPAAHGVVHALRRRGLPVPVIVLGPPEHSAARLAGVTHGGDDYLGKPFALSQLVSRLNAALLGTKPCGPRLHLDPLTQTLNWGQAEVGLSPIEYRLAARLLAHPDAVVRRRDLRASGWPSGGIVTDNTLDQYMTKLRRKLTELEAPFTLKAKRGLGYRLLPVDGAAD
jgi:two-component system response regulator MprA